MATDNPTGPGAGNPPPSPEAVQKWNSALAEYREAERVFNDAWAAHWKADEEATALLPPRPDHIFRRFPIIGISTDRQTFERVCRQHGMSEDEARSTADEFYAYADAAKAALERFDVFGLEAYAKAVAPEFHRTQDALAATPAPDLAALLVKIEIAASSLADSHADAVLADAKRLIGGEA